MKIAIVTDSNCGITADKAKELGIEIQPPPSLSTANSFSKKKVLLRRSFTRV